MQAREESVRTEDIEGWETSVVFAACEILVDACLDEIFAKLVDTLAAVNVADEVWEEPG